MKPFITLAYNSKLKLVASISLLLVCWAFASFNIAAQGLPEKCITLPQRTAACTNIIYKRSPIDMPLTNTKQGEMICICIADFATLRIEAETDAGKASQLLELRQKSIATGIAEKDLLKLIRH